MNLCFSKTKESECATSFKSSVESISVTLIQHLQPQVGSISLNNSSFFNLLFAMNFTLSKYVIRIFNFRVVQEWVVKESGNVYGASGYQSRFSEVFGGFGVEGDKRVVFGVFWLFYYYLKCGWIGLFFLFFFNYHS